MLKTTDLLTFQGSLIEDLLKATQYPWEALANIKDFLLAIGPQLGSDEYDHVAENIWIHKSAQIFDSAYLSGPLIVGPEASIRHCAFIRGSAFVGPRSVVGNSTELKNSILIEKVEVPHYNYVGDSILGPFSHLGAGAITSNVKADRQNICLRVAEKEYPTNLRKFGAILGDHVEVGCNTVLNPGTIVGKNARIYPLSMVRGFVPANSIYKTAGEVVELRE